jgi:hypothetical protein
LTPIARMVKEVENGTFRAVASCRRGPSSYVREGGSRIMEVTATAQQEILGLENFVEPHTKLINCTYDDSVGLGLNQARFHLEVDSLDFGVQC